jgi:hypothetical protein
MRHLRFTIVLICATVFFCGSAFAQQKPKASLNAPAVSVITPIFSQLVKFNFPGNFSPSVAFEQTNGAYYIQEHVQPGETVDKWTQMLTVTGAKNIVVEHPEVTPKNVALSLANHFQQACPSSFSGKGIYDGKLNGRDAFIIVASCGTAPDIKQSETAVITVIKGDKDIYTLQWAQRDKPSATPIDINVDMWSNRVKNLMPVKLCPIVPGEQSPYPSCVGGESKDWTKGTYP